MCTLIALKYLPGFRFLFALLQLGEKFYGWVIKLIELNVNNGKVDKNS